MPDAERGDFVAFSTVATPVMDPDRWPSLCDQVECQWLGTLRLRQRLTAILRCLGR